MQSWVIEAARSVMILSSPRKLRAVAESPKTRQSRWAARFMASLATGSVQVAEMKTFQAGQNVRGAMLLERQKQDVSECDQATGYARTRTVEMLFLKVRRIASYVELQEI